MKHNLTNLETMLKIKDLLRKLPDDCLSTVSEMVHDAKVRTFSMGDEVIFGRPKGRKHKGVIEALGNAKAKIRTDAGEWRVPYSLMRKVA